MIKGGLVLKKSEHLDDWYLIERAEHDGKEWLQPTETLMALANILANQLRQT